MKAYSNSLIMLLLLSIFFVACTGESGESASEEETNLEGSITKKDGEKVTINSTEDISNAISKALRDLNNGEVVEAVDFRILKAILPERLEGLARINWEGEKTGMAGLKYSIAKAKYTKGDTEVDINIIDGAGFAGIVTGLAAWSMVEVDRETTSGYERTTKLEGHKAFEKYDSQTKEGQLSVILSDRFIVNIEADNLEKEGLLRKLFAGLDINKLQKLE